MKLRGKYAWAWILWLVSFGVIEWKAIVDDDKAAGDFTLSHYARRLLGENTKVKAGHWIFRVGLGAFFVWIIPHLYRFIWAG